jgi:hypothetical protein
MQALNAEDHLATLLGPEQTRAVRFHYISILTLQTELKD